MSVQDSIKKPGRDLPPPPRAPKKRFFHKKFGDRRYDPYFYMREKDNPEVLACLKAENQYARQALKGTEALRKKLFQEIKSKIPARFDTEPAADGGYLYFVSWREGREYPIYKRRRADTGRRAASGQKPCPDETILDHNQLAKTRKYCDLQSLAVSPDHKILAYSVDSRGREIYDIFFKTWRPGKRSQNSSPRRFLILSGQTTAGLFFTRGRTL